MLTARNPLCHIVITHGLQIQEENLKFDSKVVFKQWKTEVLEECITSKRVVLVFVEPAESNI